MKDSGESIIQTGGWKKTCLINPRERQRMKSDPGHFHGSRSLSTSRLLRRASRMRQPVPSDERSLSSARAVFDRSGTARLSQRKQQETQERQETAEQTGTRRTGPGQQKTGKHQKEQTPQKSNHLEATNVYRCLREGIQERCCATVLHTRPGDLQRQLKSISWARGVVRLDEA